jgi:chemotaxis protein MotB
MSDHGGGKKRRGGPPPEEHEEHIDESWLVSYADMMTLLVALFMVLFSISSVNKSKFETLQRSLAEAFSGKILPGGQGIAEKGGSNNVKNPSTNEPYSSIQPFTGGDADAAKKGGKSAAQRKAAAEAEDKGLRELEKQVERIARSQGLAGRVTAKVTPDGLYIRVLTDDLLFDSGSSKIRPESTSLLTKLGGLLDTEKDHPILVEGHTDSVPVSGRYPSNWELSTDRASGLVRQFIAAGVDPNRLTSSGKAQLDPVASNETAAGRALNRRVDILLPRITTPPEDDTSDTTKVLAP